MSDISQLENSLALSVEPDRGELQDALAVIREIGGDAMVQRLTGDNATATKRAMGIARTALACILNPAPGSSAALEAAIVGLAIGYPGLESMTAIAKQHGIGRAAVSKRVMRFTAELGLPPSPYMKREEARQAYRQRNGRKHKRST